MKTGNGQVDQTGKQSPLVTIAAFAFTCFVLVLGYLLLGLLPTILFAFGFLGGFAFWITNFTQVSFKEIALPYFLSLSFFALHKWEERTMDFFPALSEITGVPVPETDSIGVYLLYGAAATWLLIPLLVWARYAFGYYLAWTFFTSMGVIELAHFIFPFFTGKPYGYFPGMASVIVLAPAAWLGLWKMFRNKTDV